MPLPILNKIKEISLERPLTSSLNKVIIEKIRKIGDQNPSANIKNIQEILKKTCPQKGKEEIDSLALLIWENYQQELAESTKKTLFFCFSFLAAFLAGWGGLEMGEKLAVWKFPGDKQAENISTITGFSLVAIASFWVLEKADKRLEKRILQKALNSAVNENYEDKKN